jgi:hypothetical protein
MQRCIVWIRGHRICRTSAQKRAGKINSQRQKIQRIMLSHWWAGLVGCPRNKNLGSNRNKPKQDLFRLCFGLFRETKNKKFRFVSVCFGVSTLYRNNWNKNCFETNKHFLKNTKYALYQTVMVVFCLFRFNRNIETLCFGIEPKQPKQTCDFVRDGRAATPAFSVPHRLPWQELPTCELMEVPAAVIEEMYTTIRNKLPRKEGIAWYSIVDPCLLWLLSAFGSIMSTLYWKDHPMVPSLNLAPHPLFRQLEIPLVTLNLLHRWKKD